MRLLIWVWSSLKTLSVRSVVFVWDDGYTAATDGPAGFFVRFFQFKAPQTGSKKRIPTMINSDIMNNTTKFARIPPWLPVERGSEVSTSPHILTWDNPVSCERHSRKGGTGKSGSRREREERIISLTPRSSHRFFASSSPSLNLLQSDRLLWRVTDNLLKTRWCKIS